MKKLRALRSRSNSPLEKDPIKAFRGAGRGRYTSEKLIRDRKKERLEEDARVIGTPDSFVLDTSAILALWNEEDGASTVEKVLRDKPHHRKIFISFMTFMECRSDDELSNLGIIRRTIPEVSPRY